MKFTGYYYQLDDCAEWSIGLFNIILEQNHTELAARLKIKAISIDSLKFKIHQLTIQKLTHSLSMN